MDDLLDDADPPPAEAVADPQPVPAPVAFGGGDFEDLFGPSVQTSSELPVASATSPLGDLLDGFDVPQSTPRTSPGLKVDVSSFDGVDAPPLFADFAPPLATSVPPDAPSNVGIDLLGGFDDVFAPPSTMSDGAASSVFSGGFMDDVPHPDSSNFFGSSNFAAAPPDADLLGGFGDSTFSAEPTVFAATPATVEPPASASLTSALAASFTSYDDWPPSHPLFSSHESWAAPSAPAAGAAAHASLASASDGTAMDAAIISGLPASLATSMPSAATESAATEAQPSSVSGNGLMGRPVLGELMVPVSPAEEVPPTTAPFVAAPPSAPAMALGSSSSGHSLENDPNQLTSPLGTELLHRKVSRQQSPEGRASGLAEHELRVGAMPAELAGPDSPFDSALLQRKMSKQAATEGGLDSPADSALLQRKMSKQAAAEGGVGFGEAAAAAFFGISNAAAEASSEAGGSSTGPSDPFEREAAFGLTSAFEQSELSSPMSAQLLARKVARQHHGSVPEWLEGADAAMPGGLSGAMDGAVDGGMVGEVPSSPMSTELMARKVARQSGLGEVGEAPSSPMSTELMARKVARQSGLREWPMDDDESGSPQGLQMPSSPMSTDLLNMKVARQTGLNEQPIGDPNELTSPASTQVGLACDALDPARCMCCPSHRPPRPPHPSPPPPRYASSSSHPPRHVPAPRLFPLATFPPLASSPPRTSSLPPASSAYLASA